jgi:hypothetical protein
MTDELSSFIDTVYRERYSLISNNCIHKSLRIKAKAEEIGRGGDLICCLSILPIKKFHNFLIVIPHIYTKIDGRKVDVALDPKTEELYCKNDEQKLIMPVNISRMRRIIGREGSN